MDPSPAAADAQYSPSPPRRWLSDNDIRTFRRDGVLVVDHLLSSVEVNAGLHGVEETLTRHDVVEFFSEVLGVEKDDASVQAFARMSSTNGSGGVLDVFYEAWKLDIATHTKLFAITQQLWEECYCHRDEESKASLAPNGDSFGWRHPYDPFDCRKGYLYMDRIGYRLPTTTAQAMGDRIHPHKKKKARNLQRSLTPHLDCCPETFYDQTTANKWRPIQCFVSLTNNLEANTGGFEAAKGFHREFDDWANARPPTQIVQKSHRDGRSSSSSFGSKELTNIPAPCLGRYTHIRPKEDKEIMDRVQHIPVSAGSAVFWDNRIPHANAYQHTGIEPRIVVYCSFLPDIELNRRYVEKQLADFRAGKPPRDQWNHIGDDQVDSVDASHLWDYVFTPLGRRLMGMDPWENERDSE